MRGTYVGILWGALCAVTAFGVPVSVYDAIATGRSESGLRFQSLRRIIDEPRNRITSLNRLLRHLKRRHPALLRHFTLVYGSQSLFHDAVSRRYPRVIFHDGSLVLAVTGDPTKEESYESLELFELKADDSAFERHLVQFRDERAVYDEIPQERRCESCHGTPFRPRWGSYPLWDGVVGASSDRLTPEERTTVTAFLARLGRRDMRRYRYFLQRGQPFPPPESPAELAPNLRLGLHLSALNYRRIMASLVASPVYRWYRYALYGALIHCGDIESFLPAELVMAHRGRLGQRYEALERETRESNLADFNRRLARHRAFNSGEADALNFDDNVTPIAAVRYLLEGQSIDLALDVSEWSMSHSRGGTSYCLSNGSNGFGDFFHRNFFPQLISEEPRLPRLFRYSVYPREAECRDLADRSRVLLAEMLESQSDESTSR